MSISLKHHLVSPKKMMIKETLKLYTAYILTLPHIIRIIAFFNCVVVTSLDIDVRKVKDLAYITL